MPLGPSPSHLPIYTPNSIPFIGWAMRLAKHIAIRRASKASQVRMCGVLCVVVYGW